MAAADMSSLESLDSIDSFGDGTGVQDVSMTTESPNQSLDDFGDNTSADNASNIVNGVGQWGATIAGILTKQPTVSTPGGVAVGAPAVRAAAPGLVGTKSQASSLMIVLLFVGVLFVGFALMPKN